MRAHSDHIARRRVLAAAVAVVTASALLGPVARGAEHVGTSGSIAQTHRGGQQNEAGQHIVWSQFVDLEFSGARIVASDTHGRNAHPLTHPGQGVVDIDPKVSPNGRSVAFERDDAHGTSHVMLVGIHGRRLHEVDVGCTDPCIGANGPTWTPDGRHLIFEKVIGPIDSHGNAQSALLWRTDLTGDHVERLSPTRLDNVVEDLDAQFAPAGYMVVSRVNLARDQSAIFRMRPDTTHACRLTPWRLNADLADVSPARTGPTRNLVVFETYGHGGPPRGKVSAIATVLARCQGAHRIRYVTSRHSNPVWHFNPSWAPHGRKLVFVRFKSVNGDPVVHGDIVRSRWDGTRQALITARPLFDFRPNWGPAPRR